MKKLFFYKRNFYILLLSAILASTLSCSNDERFSTEELTMEEFRVVPRFGGCTGFSELVKERVSERDNIPISEITSCFYYGPYIGGYCEYHCTTTHFGNPVYIIGEDSEGW